MDAVESDRKACITGVRGGARATPAPWLVLAVVTVLAGCGVGGGLPSSANSQAITADEIFAFQNRSCGPIDLAPLIPDCPLNLICFSDACEAHNVCYSQCGASKAKCDLDFFNEMMNACSRSFRRGGPDAETCRSLAFSYWLAVATLGQGAFDATQETGCSFDDGLPPSLTACCLPDGACDQQASRTACEDRGGRFLAATRCGDFECAPPENDACADAITICEELAPMQDFGFCEGDGSPCDPQQPSCPDGSVCLPTMDETLQCNVVTDNRVATTDGPVAGGDCAASGVDSFQADIWYEFVAPCTGRLVARMCDRPSFDGMLAVYANPDDSSACVCPAGGGALVQCDDDFCGGGSGPAIVIDEATQGACYTIRIGGWSEDGTADRTAQAIGELNIRMTCDDRESGE